MSPGQIFTANILVDYVCTKFGQNPLKDVDSGVVTRMLQKDGWKDAR
jgi:hypothetical protein